eukprot:4749786-Pleurochrysis_carterae.AAC.1
MVSIFRGNRHHVHLSCRSDASDRATRELIDRRGGAVDPLTIIGLKSLAFRVAASVRDDYGRAY